MTSNLRELYTNSHQEDGLRVTPLLSATMHHRCEKEYTVANSKDKSFGKKTYSIKFSL